MEYNIQKIIANSKVVDKAILQNKLTPLLFMPIDKEGVTYFDIFTKIVDSPMFPENKGLNLADVLHEIHYNKNYNIDKLTVFAKRFFVSFQNYNRNSPIKFLNKDYKQKIQNSRFIIAARKGIYTLERRKP